MFGNLLFQMKSNYKILNIQFKYHTFAKWWRLWLHSSKSLRNNPYWIGCFIGYFLAKNTDFKLESICWLNNRVSKFFCIFYPLVVLFSGKYSFSFKIKLMSINFNKFNRKKNVVWWIWTDWTISSKRLFIEEQSRFIIDIWWFLEFNVAE